MCVCGWVCGITILRLSPPGLHGANIRPNESLAIAPVDVGEGGRRRPRSPVPGRGSVVSVSADERRWRFHAPLPPPLSLIYRVPSCRPLVLNSAFLGFPHAAVCVHRKHIVAVPSGRLPDRDATSVFIPTTKLLIQPGFDGGLRVHSGGGGGWPPPPAATSRSPGRWGMTPLLSCRKTLLLISLT